VIMATLNNSWSTRVGDGITHLGFKSETNSVQDTEKPSRSPGLQAVWARHSISILILNPDITVTFSVHLVYVLKTMKKHMVMVSLMFNTQIIGGTGHPQIFS
jgi:hypothetical protein